MGNACSKRPVTVEHRDEALEPASLFKCLQQDLQSARYTNVHSLGEDIIVHGCTVALAKRERKEGRPAKKVFIKCHNHVRGRHFDSASAKSEVELLHKLSKDPAVCKHLPRLERAIWLDSKSSRRPQVVSESPSDRSQRGGGSIPANSSHVLMLEFNHRAGKLLATVSKEGMRLTERQAGDMCLQLLHLLQALHALHLHHGHIGGSSLVLTSCENGGGKPRNRRHDEKRSSLDAFAAQDLSIMNGPSTMSSPGSLLSHSDGEDSDGITDEMTSWLLPGFPTGVDSPRVAEEEAAGPYDHLNPDSARGSVFDAATMLAQKQGIATAAHNAGSAVAEGQTRYRERWQPFLTEENCDVGSQSTSEGGGMDLTRVSQRTHYRTPRSRVPEWLLRSEVVNEVFEGLASCSSALSSPGNAGVRMIKVKDMFHTATASPGLHSRHGSSESFMTAEEDAVAEVQPPPLPSTLPEESAMIMRPPLGPATSSTFTRGLSGSTTNAAAWWHQGVDGDWNAREAPMYTPVYTPPEPVAEGSQTRTRFPVNADDTEVFSCTPAHAAFAAYADYVSSELGDYDSTEMFPFARVRVVDMGVERQQPGGGPMGEGLEQKGPGAVKSTVGRKDSSSAASALQDSLAALQKASNPAVAGLAGPSPANDSGTTRAATGMGMGAMNGAMPAQIGVNGAAVPLPPGAMPYMMPGGPYAMHNGMGGTNSMAPMMPNGMHMHSVMHMGGTAAAANGGMAAPGGMHAPDGMHMQSPMHMGNATGDGTNSNLVSPSSMASPTGMHMQNGVAWGAPGAMHHSPMMQHGMMQPGGAPGMHAPAMNGMVMQQPYTPFEGPDLEASRRADSSPPGIGGSPPQAPAAQPSGIPEDGEGGTSKWSFEVEDAVPSMKSLFCEIEAADAAPVDWDRAKREVRKQKKKRKKQMGSQVGSVMSEFGGYGGYNDVMGSSMMTPSPARGAVSMMSAGRVALPELRHRQHYARSDDAESQISHRSHRSHRSARSVGSALHGHRHPAFENGGNGLDVGARKWKGASGAQGAFEGNPECPACNRLREMCTDCRLRTTQGRLPGIARSEKRTPAAKTAGKKGKVGKETREKATRAAAAANERPVHVLVHMHGVTPMEPHSGTARLIKVHKDTAAVGAAVLLAITGERKDVGVLQKHIRSRHPASKDASWMMLSSEARSLIEGLIMERYTPDEALRQAWLQHHVRLAARVPKVAQTTRSAFDDPADGKRARGARGKPPLSSASSPLTIQHVGDRKGRGDKTVTSPRLPRRESGASLASQASMGGTRRGGGNRGRPPLARADSNASVASRVSNSSRAADGSFLAPKITEERIDARGKKHVVTSFVMPPRASSGNAPPLHQMQAARVSSGPPPALKKSASVVALKRTNTSGQLDAGQDTVSQNGDNQAALDPVAHMKQQLHLQLKQQQLQMQAQSPLQPQPTPAAYAAEPPSGPSAVSQSPDRDSFPRPPSQLSGPDAQPQGPSSQNSKRSASSHHSSQPASTNALPASEAKDDGAATADSRRESVHSGADKVTVSASVELTHEEEHADNSTQKQNYSIPDGKQSLKSHAVSAPKSSDSTRHSNSSNGTGHKSPTKPTPVVESTSSAMDKSASAFGEPEESLIGASNATVWWRAPWSVEQTSEPESLVRPSSIKAVELLTQAPSPEPSPAASAPKSTKNSILGASKGSRMKPLVLRSPPTPVPLVLSASAKHTILSPAQQTSLSQVAKPSTPSPPGHGDPSNSAASPTPHAPTETSGESSVYGAHMPAANAGYCSISDAAAAAAQSRIPTLKSEG